MEMAAQGKKRPAGGLAELVEVSPLAKYAPAVGIYLNDHRRGYHAHRSYHSLTHGLSRLINLAGYPGERSAAGHGGNPALFADLRCDNRLYRHRSLTGLFTGRVLRWVRPRSAAWHYRQRSQHRLASGQILQAAKAGRHIVNSLMPCR